MPHFGHFEKKKQALSKGLLEQFLLREIVYKKGDRDAMLGNHFMIGHLCRPTIFSRA